MTLGVCYFFFPFFNSWARDLLLDKCLELYFFFSNGDNLSTSQAVFLSLLVASSGFFFSSVSLSLAVLFQYFLCFFNCSQVVSCSLYLYLYHKPPFQLPQRTLKCVSTTGTKVSLQFWGHYFLLLSKTTETSGVMPTTPNISD